MGINNVHRISNFPLPPSLLTNKIIYTVDTSSLSNSQYLNSTLEVLLFTSQFVGLSGSPIDGRHISALSILFDDESSLFFLLQGSACGLMKSAADAGSFFSIFADCLKAIPGVDVLWSQ